MIKLTKDIKVKRYTNSADTKGKEIFLSEFLGDVRSNQGYKKKIEYLRKLKTERKQKAYKKGSLPGVTISGLCGDGSRKDEGIVKYNYLMCLDFDHLDGFKDVAVAREKLIQDPFTLALSVSSRGNGLFAIVKVDDLGGKLEKNKLDYASKIKEYHVSIFKDMEKYYKQHHDLQIDKACKNTSRLRFASSDPELFINPDAETFSMHTESSMPEPEEAPFVDSFDKESNKAKDAPSPNDIHKLATNVIGRIRKSNSKEKFNKLFSDGTWEGLYDSPSEADQALCDIIAYRTDVPQVIDEVMRMSKLYRAKWDNDDYKNRTIKNALSFVEGEKKKQLDADLGGGVDIEFALTDLGNCERLLKRLDGNARYLQKGKQWLVWEPKKGIWIEGAENQIIYMAKEMVRSIAKEVEAVTDSKVREEVVKWAKASQSKARILSAAKLVESERVVSITPEALDKDPWLLNCMNGTLDLRTGKLREHCREDYITKRIPVEFDPDAKCPVWLSFLDRVMGGNQNLISFLQRMVGYSLTGSNRDQCFFALRGDGSNGKNVFVDTTSALLGDYSQVAPFKTFLSNKFGDGNSANNDIARMKGMRFVSASEGKQGRELAEDVIKNITGDKKIAARFNYGDFFEFEPQFKLFLISNFKPKISAEDPAIWRRVKLILFAEKISEDEIKAFLDKYGTNITDYLAKNELAGILNWAIEGCLEWQKNGLQPPAEVESATDEYRKEMDTVEEFLDERCALNIGQKRTTTDLHEAYEKHCKRNGVESLSLKGFGKALDRKGFPTEPPVRGKRLRPIGLHADADDSDNY
jgi:putative DNA primase/helicase